MRVMLSLGAFVAVCLVALGAIPIQATESSRSLPGSYSFASRELAWLGQANDYTPYLKASGQGSCGQFCDDISIGKFECTKHERPVYDNQGNCHCEVFPECQ
jgi:hypothetical protein